MAARRFSGSKWRLKVSANSSTSPCGARGVRRPRCRWNGAVQVGSGRSAAMPMRAVRRRRAGLAVAEVGEAGQARRERGVARQLGHEALPQAACPWRAARAASVSIFMRAMSTPVGHSRRQALQLTQRAIASAIVVPGHGVRPELPRERPAQRVGAAAGEVGLLARDAVGRAHGPGVEAAAGAVVVAHLDGGQEAALRRPVQPPG